MTEAEGGGVGDRPIDLQQWLRSFAVIASAVNQPVGLSELLNLVARTASELTQYDFCGVLLPDDEGRRLLIAGAHGLSTDYLAQVNSEYPIVLSSDENAAPSSRAYLSRAPIQVSDIAFDDAFEPWTVGAREQGFHSMVSVPLIVATEVLGTLNCYTRIRHEFGPDEMGLLSVLSDQAAIAIATARLRDEQSRTIVELSSLNASLEQQYQLFRQGEEIHRRLTTAALRGGGVHAAAEILADLLKRPVVVTDEIGDILASVASDGCVMAPPDPSATAQLLAGDPGGGVAQILEIVEPGAGEVPRLPGPRLAAPVSLGGEIAAHIWLPGAARDLGTLYRRAVEHTATVMALEILRARTAMDGEWAISGEVVTDLITTGRALDSNAAQRAERLGHNLATPHAMLIARSDSSSHHQRQRILHVVRSAARSVQPRPLISTDGDHVVAIWPISDTDLDGSTMFAIARKIQMALRRMYPDDTASVAITPRCSSVGDYPAAFRIGRGALEIARTRGQINEILTVDNLGVYGLLLQLEDTGELTRYTDRVLGKLRAYDQRQGTSLVETVAIYVRNDLNTARTGEALYVHANTVGLRIKRAEQLLGMSFGNTDDLVHVTMALTVDHLTGVHGAAN